jgi:hypothetical protein
MRNKEVREALTDALEFLEGLGYTGGDVHDDLAAAIEKLERRKRCARPYHPWRACEAIRINTRG